MLPNDGYLVTLNHISLRKGSINVSFPLIADVQLGVGAYLPLMVNADNAEVIYLFSYWGLLWAHITHQPWWVYLGTSRQCVSIPWSHPDFGHESLYHTLSGLWELLNPLVQEVPGNVLLQTLNIIHSQRNPCFFWWGTAFIGHNVGAQWCSLPFFIGSDYF